MFNTDLFIKILIISYALTCLKKIMAGSMELEKETRYNIVDTLDGILGFIIIAICFMF